MNERALGRTGIRVSEVGFGCGNVGGLMVRGSHQEQVEAVRRAIQLGFTYLDTAPSYGNGASETNLGAVLAEPRPQVVVGTKVRLAPDDLKDARGAILRSVEASLRRLRRSAVDVIYLHNPLGAGSAAGASSSGALTASQVLGPSGAADALERVRAQGLTRAIGFTGTGDTDALHQVVESGRFDVMQAYYNLLNPSAGQAMPGTFKAQDFRLLIRRAAQRGMGVVAIRVMAGGAVAGPEARRGHAAREMGGAMAGGGDYALDEARAKALDVLVPQEVASRAELALRFVLQNPDVSTALVGFSSLQQVQEAAACSGRPPLPETALSALGKAWNGDAPSAS
jgi:aryl-alcohol dehydrogenase-like predicted oxidoreductase